MMTKTKTGAAGRVTGTSPLKTRRLRLPRHLLGRRLRRICSPAAPTHRTSLRASWTVLHRAAPRLPRVPPSAISWASMSARPSPRTSQSQLTEHRCLRSSPSTRRSVRSSLCLQLWRRVWRNPELVLTHSQLLRRSLPGLPAWTLAWARRPRRRRRPLPLRRWRRPPGCLQVSLRTSLPLSRHWLPSHRSPQSSSSAPPSS